MLGSKRKVSIGGFVRFNGGVVQREQYFVKEVGQREQWSVIREKAASSKIIGSFNKLVGDHNCSDLSARNIAVFGSQ